MAKDVTSDISGDPLSGDEHIECEVHVIISMSTDTNRRKVEINELWDLSSAEAALVTTRIEALYPKLKSQIEKLLTG